MAYKGISYNPGLHVPTDDIEAEENVNNDPVSIFCVSKGYFSNYCNIICHIKRIFLLTQFLKIYIKPY